jgi:hypothetical protein
LRLPPRDLGVEITQHSFFLIGLTEDVIAKASPRDTIWGIGLGAANPAARDPRRWRGENLLGFALMEVRARLRAGPAGA